MGPRVRAKGHDGFTLVNAWAQIFYKKAREGNPDNLSLQYYWQIKHINGETFSVGRLRQAMDGSQAYTLVFEKPNCAEVHCARNTI